LGWSGPPHPATIPAVSGTLFLVGTPIGNLGDLAPRATETLANADLIAAEDTRRTGRLLAGLGIGRPPMVSLFEGNEAKRTVELLERLRRGDSVALVTDGGMPAISDPGFRLVRACADEGIDVRVVPGPSAPIAALVVSGLPTDRFVFEGFLPRARGDRTARLEALRMETRTVVVFESPKRFRSLLRELIEIVGDRRVVVARELTKLHEQVVRGRASDVVAELGDADPKGEIVLVIEGRPEGATADLPAAVDEANALIAGGMKTRPAARTVAERHGLGANEVYRAIVEANTGAGTSPR
jgi:16S rRNA (cytidine1402-2'-O)-methyltransferase